MEVCWCSDAFFVMLRRVLLYFRHFSFLLLIVASVLLLPACQGQHMAQQRQPSGPMLDLIRSEWTRQGQPPLDTPLASRIMSGRFAQCDDGKTNLTLDWNGSNGDYLCLDRQNWDSQPVTNTGSMLVCEPGKPRPALHFCMTEKIEYKDVPPTSGDHRPVWPVYGEYLYLPVQRWLHSMEHGAIVMLYHPCADKAQIDLLKSVVTSCLRRYIITPYNKLPRSTPFALLAWGCKLLMEEVSQTAAKDFIMSRAKHGPEEIADDGEFQDQLLKKSNIVSNFADAVLCPESISDGGEQLHMQQNIPKKSSREFFMR